MSFKRPAKNFFIYFLSTVTVYSSIAMLIFAYYFFNQETTGGLYFLIAAQLTRLVFKEFSSSLDIALSSSFLLLYAILAPNILVFRGINSTFLICVYILIADALTISSKIIRRPNTISSGPRKYYYVAFFSSAVAIGFTTYILPVPSLSLMIPIGAALFFQEALLRSGQGVRSAWLTFLAFEISIGAYVLLHWTGYGRLAIASYLLMPFAVLASYHRTYVQFWHLLVASPALMLGAFLVRGESTKSLTSEVAIGVTDHLIYTRQLLDGVLPHDAGVVKFVQQNLLLYLNWFPRSLWNDKPVGAGYYSVDVISGRLNVGEEHNISLGFLGELSFLLENYYAIGLLFVLVQLIVLRNFLSNRAYSNGVAALVAFDLSLVTYFWGGMAAFGSRAWFVIISIVMLTQIIRFERR